MAATETALPPAPARRRRRRATAIDVAVLVGVAVLVVFPVAARLAAGRLPRGAPPALAPLPAGLAHPRLRDVPVGLRGGGVEGAAVGLLGEARARRLLRIVRMGTSGDPLRGRYPYHYRPLDRVLPVAFGPGQVAAATDLGAKLILLDRVPSGRTWAAPAAFAVLDRARAGGACDPSIDLWLLVAADQAVTTDRIIATEAVRARRACRGDPTPGWLYGEYQSTVGLPGMRSDNAEPRPAAATFARLVRALPGAGAAWSGAADALVREALATPSDRPWVARHLYERALVRYRRAAQLNPGPQADTGVARALAGLGRYGEAAGLQRRAVDRLRGVQLPLAQLVVYLEGAHRWAAAAHAADQLLQVPAPHGPALYPAPPSSAEFQSEDAYGPVSLGARAAPLQVNLAHPPSPPAAAVPVADFTFLPRYRDSGLIGSDRWCAGFSRARDLLLAGHPSPALRLPTSVVPASALAAAGQDCSSNDDPPLLAGVARVEAGDRRAARNQHLQDARQNLWRWAGELGHAERAAREWVRLTPGWRPWLRLAEIEFWRHRYNDAAADFGGAVSFARTRLRPRLQEEATAMLDRGAALVAAGRRDEAEDALRAANELASGPGAVRAGYELASRGAYPVFNFISYYALVQLGEAEREAGALPAAAEAYASASDFIPGLLDSPHPVHREQLENNAAIVDIARGRTAAAVASTRRALAVDPENPAFLMTAAFAAHRNGDDAQAIRLNRAALAADHTAYPAANDLGVLLARHGHDAAALAALRRSVGASGDYALGWFNLGVVLGRMGPLHLLSSQGALAKAFALDPALRDRQRTPTLDEKTYRSALDVSRPLPPKWTFASSQPHAPAKTAGLVALLAAAFGLSRALQARSGRGLAETWLERVDHASGKLKPLARLTHPAIAIVVTLAVLALPLIRSPGGGTSAALAGALGLVVLVGVALRARSAAAGREGVPSAPGRTWPPGIAFGLAAAAAGLSWAPLPVLGAKESPRLHWAAPAALAVVAVPLVLATVWLDLPLTRALAAAALVMAASLLTPIKPVDGGAIAAAGGTAAGIAGIGLAAVIVLGLV